MTEHAQKTRQEPHQEVSARTAWVAAVGVLLLLLVIYRATVMPTVVDQDSGELATVAYTMGVAHPPGYPLWVLIGKLFTLIPVGDVAFRVNLMSAVLTSVSMGVVFLFCYRVTGLLLPSTQASYQEQHHHTSVRNDDMNHMQNARCPMLQPIP